MLVQCGTPFHGETFTDIDASIVHSHGFSKGLLSRTARFVVLLELGFQKFDFFLGQAGFRFSGPGHLVVLNQAAVMWLIDVQRIVEVSVKVGKVRVCRKWICHVGVSPRRPLLLGEGSHYVTLGAVAEIEAMAAAQCIRDVAKGQVV